MAQQTIDIGSAIDDGTGDKARIAFDKCNDNFTELYAASGTTDAEAVQDIVGAMLVDSLHINWSYNDTLGQASADIYGSSIENAKLAYMADSTIKGRVAGSGSGNPVDLTAAQALTAIGAAPLASPTFTGDPKAPTPTAGDNDTSIATTAFVTTAVAAVGGASLTAPQGRLTLQSATPVMTTTQAAKTTIYYTPYTGNLCPIYNGTSFAMTAFAELSQATTDTTKSPAAVAANSNYDLFVWNDAGSVRLSRGPAWTNATTRSAGTALVRVDGIWLNNASITNGPAASRGTYVGTIRSNASSQIDFQFGSRAANGGEGIIGVWNAYNRVNLITRVQTTTATWTYNSATARNKQASATWRVSFVSGLEEDSWHALAEGTTQTGTANLAYTLVGLDAPFSSAFPAFDTSDSWASSAANIGVSSLMGTSIGFHYVTASDQCATATGAVTYVGGESSHLTFTWRC